MEQKIADILTPAGIKEKTKKTIKYVKKSYQAIKEKYNFREGEKLYIIENEDGFTVTPFNHETEEWAKAFDKTNQKYKNTFKKLAKSLNDFSDDFLENRNQLEIQDREEL